MKNVAGAVALLLGFCSFSAAWSQAPASAAMPSGEEAHYIVRYDAKCMAEELRRCTGMKTLGTAKASRYSCSADQQELAGYLPVATPCAPVKESPKRAACAQLLADAPPARCERKEFTTSGWADFMRSQMQVMEVRLKDMCLAAGHKPEVCERKVDWPSTTPGTPR